MNTKPKSLWQKLWHEIKSILGIALYFGFWLGLLMLLKRLMLANYDIGFSGVSTAIIGALVIAKVVILMEYIPLGHWVRQQPAIVDIVLRTLLYTLGVLIAFLLEKAFESRHEEGGFGSALIHVFRNRDIYTVWVGTIVIGVSLLSFNVLSVLRKYFGEHFITQLLFKTPLADVEAKRMENKTPSA